MAIGAKYLLVTYGRAGTTTTGGAYGIILVIVVSRRRMSVQ